MSSSRVMWKWMWHCCPVLCWVSGATAGEDGGGEGPDGGRDGGQATRDGRHHLRWRVYLEDLRLHQKEAGRRRGASPRHVLPWYGSMDVAQCMLCSHYVEYAVKVKALWHFTFNVKGAKLFTSNDASCFSKPVLLSVNCCRMKWKAEYPSEVH